MDKYTNVAIVARVPCGTCRDWPVERQPYCGACSGRGYREQELLEAGEPFFLVRGKDELAPLTVELYRLLYRDLSNRVRGWADPSMLLGLDQRASAIERWQADNPSLVKLPD